MEKLNYKLVGKKETIESLVSGEINTYDLSQFRLIDIENQEVSLLNEVSVEEVLDAIDNENILFVREVSDEEYDEDNDWDKEEETAHVKKKISR